MTSGKLFRGLSLIYLALSSVFWLFDKTNQATYLAVMAIYFQVAQKIWSDDEGAK
jgi:hypothetical protein